MSYLSEEREIMLQYDPIRKKWLAWTNMPDWAKHLKNRGWKQTKISKENGKAIDWEFEIEDRKAITFRDMTKPKREGPKPEILQNALRSDLSGFYA